MQPNDQNQQPQNPSAPSGGYMSPSGAEVPEYLHMEPVADPIVATKKKRKAIASVLIFLLVILLAGAGIGYWWWMKTEPERRFYQSLEALMSVPYVQREMTVDTTGASVGIEAKSDFSDPSNPKSMYAYTYAPVSSSDKSELPYTVSGNLVVISNKSGKYFAKITEYFGTLPTDTKLNQWYTVHADQNAALYDPTAARNLVNNSLGQFVYGKLDAKTKGIIIQGIRDNKVYSITNGGESGEYYVYGLTVSYKKMAELNKLIAKTLNTEQPATSDVTSSKMQVWIDKKTLLPVRTIENVEREVDSSKATNTTVYSYPNSLSITQPEGV